MSRGTQDGNVYFYYIDPLLNLWFSRIPSGVSYCSQFRMYIDYQWARDVWRKEAEDG